MPTRPTGDFIKMEPNIYYDQADERPEVKIKLYSDSDALADATVDGKVDIAFHLGADRLHDIRALDHALVKTFEVGYHYMMWHNMDRPNMQDVDVRGAIDLAIDRYELTQDLSGGVGTRSLFPYNTPYYNDGSGIEGDTDGAEALLDSAGWTLASDGKRYKDDELLNINLVAYAQRPGLVLMQPTIAAALRSVGFNVTEITTPGDSWDALDNVIIGRTFDLLMWAQNTLPAGDPSWFLNNFFRSTACSVWCNLAGLNSSTVDSLLDDLDGLGDHDARVAATTAAHDAILAEVPVSNLMTPAWHVGLSSRMESYEPYGSDYYVIHPDLFVTNPVTDVEGCHTSDSGDWYYKKSKRNCDWVAKKPHDRCKKAGHGDDTATALDSCPIACSSCNCDDDGDWYLSKKPSRGCDYVAKKPTSRCDKEGADGSYAFDSCPYSCGTCGCQDSKAWKYKGRKIRMCDWVAKKPTARCYKTDPDDVKAEDACLVACENCPLGVIVIV